MERIYRSYILIATCCISVHTQEPRTFADACSAIRCKHVLTHIPQHVLDHTDSHGNTLLHYAVNYQRPHTTSWLLQYMSPNIANHDGHTPLHVALTRKDAQLTHMLLKHGAITNHAGPSGDLPMHYAIQMRTPELVHTIASLRPSTVDMPGINTDPALASNSETPLHRALHINNIDAFQQLVSHDARTDIFDTDGKSYLYYACKWDRPAMANMLFAYIDINAPDQSGNYPIHHAVETNNIDMMSYILSQSPQAGYQRTKATDGQVTRHSVPRQIANTPLHLVRDPRALDMLVTHTRNIIPYNAEEHSPLVYAVRKYLRPERYPNVSRDEMAHVICEFIKRGAMVHDSKAVTHIHQAISEHTSNHTYTDTTLLVTAALSLSKSTLPEVHSTTPPKTLLARHAILYHAHELGYTPYTCGTRFDDHGDFIPQLTAYAHEQHDAQLLNMIRSYQHQANLEKLQNSSYFYDINILIS